MVSMYECFERCMIPGVKESSNERCTIPTVKGSSTTVSYSLIPDEQNQLKAAEGLLEAVDRTAKQVSKKEDDANHATSSSYLEPARPGARTSQRPRPAALPVLESVVKDEPSTVPLPVISAFERRDAPHVQAEPAHVSLTSRPQVEPASRGSNGARTQDSSGSSRAASIGSKEANTAGLEAPGPSQQPSLASLFRDPIPPPRASEDFSTAAAQPTRNFEAGASAPSADKPSPAPAASAAPVLPQASTSGIIVSKPRPADVPGNGHDMKDSVAATSTSTSSPTALTSASADQPLGTEEGVSPPGRSSTAEDQLPRPPVIEVVQPRTAAFSAAPESSPLHGSPADAIAEAIKAAAAATGSDMEGAEDVDGPMDSKVREARLARMVENLKRRLEQLKAENEQLEEMLRQADARASGRSGEVGKLEDELAKASAAESLAKAALIDASTRHKAEVEGLHYELNSTRATLIEAQKRLATAEEEKEGLLQEREESETRMLTVLREEVASVERRLEDERFNAASARQSFTAREQELEAALAESAVSLASQQRAADERARRLADAETQAASLKAEAAGLRGEIATLQAQLQQHSTPIGSPSGVGAQELQERAASLQAALHNSESRRQALEAELSELRNDVEHLRSQAAKPPAVPLEMEQRFKEVTELLYQKQSQLEALGAERAAQQMAWERELASVREEAERTRRRVATDRAAVFADSDLVVPMEDMGGAYVKLANNKRVGKAVKAGARFLDVTALTASRFLRQYPLGRLAVFSYVVLIHLFLWFTINHMQRRALTGETLGMGRLKDT